MASYSIEVPHFYELVYSEGGRRLTLEIDLRDEVPCIYGRAIEKWAAPHDGETLSDEKRDQIIQRIYEYLTQVKKCPKVEIER